MFENGSGSFSTTTKVNPREKCKEVTTRRGAVVGLKDESEYSEKKTNEGVVKMSDAKEVVEKEQKNEVLAKEEEKEISEVEKQKLKKTTSNKGKVVIDHPAIQHLPYPHAPSKKDKEKQYSRFLDIFKKLQINIPFTEALEQMPTYAKFMKEFLTKKRRTTDDEMVELEVGCSAIIQKSIPEKSQDPSSFTIPVTIGRLSVGRALLDLGANIYLMLLSMIKHIREVEIRPTRIALQLADKTIKHPYGIIEDVLVKVNKFLFPVDFVVMDMDEDNEVPLILGRPFMKISKVIIDVDDAKLTVRVQGGEVQFNVFEAMKHPKDKGECF
ncbi:uncharacterized protein LOC114389812 [Glycine soja]|uniref:uncharacterized protein LOC114389812 n=1 Tax=Glycine soja TaxID=3848 RepID=UPI00103E6109|nr:uncharacterized protein LOC114389812 [Glycine soja]